MALPPVTEQLQAATTIAKTTQTLIGKEIACGGYDFLTLFFTYTKGDETGLKIVPSFMRTTGGTAHPYAVKTESAGAITLTDTTLTLTATRTSYMTFDVRGFAYARFTQGGSNNDGTPTGTLLAGYTLK
jgi:hypothetical protein